MDATGHETVTARDWDDRVARLTRKLPTRLAGALDWLREPSRRLVRIAAALLFILGGVFSILPVLGLWMLPLGLALSALGAVFTGLAGWHGGKLILHHGVGIMVSDDE